MKPDDEPVETIMDLAGYRQCIWSFELDEEFDRLLSFRALGYHHGKKVAIKLQDGTMEVFICLKDNVVRRYRPYFVPVKPGGAARVVPGSYLPGERVRCWVEP